MWKGAAARGNRLTSSIRSLPLAAWARHLKGGRIVLQGRLTDPLDLGDARVMPGPVVLSLTFTGGPKPAVGHTRVDGEIRAGGNSGSTLAIDAKGAWLGPHAVATSEPYPRLVERVVDAMADVVMDAEATALSELAMAFPVGIEVVVPGEEPILVSGATTGAPGALVLAEPLIVQIGGAGLRIGHRQLRWLANAAQVSVSQARLHANGTVELEGGARSGLGRIAQSGLDVVGEQLTELVWTAPQFERVRGFLRPLPES